MLISILQETDVCWVARVLGFCRLSSTLASGWVGVRRRPENVRLPLPRPSIARHVHAKGQTRAPAGSNILSIKGSGDFRAAARCPQVEFRQNCIATRLQGCQSGRTQAGVLADCVAAA